MHEFQPDPRGGRLCAGVQIGIVGLRQVNEPTIVPEIDRQQMGMTIKPESLPHQPVEMAGKKVGHEKAADFLFDDPVKLRRPGKQGIAMGMRQTLRIILRQHRIKRAASAAFAIGHQHAVKFVIGTVKGDIHDIGKNLVGMMLEGAGFEVIDLGINNPVENYLAAIDKHQPAVLGMSALLTTTMPYMGVVIEELDKRGILKTLPVMVGGAPLNQEFADAVGATKYGRDAAVSAELARALVGQNR